MNWYAKAKFVALLVLVAMPCIATATTTSISAWMTRPGTIANATQLPNGTHVVLDAVIIDKIDAKSAIPYFTVREAWNANDRICILTVPSPSLRRNQLVDIAGDLSTLATGDRALENVTVTGYTAEDGTLLVRGGPVFKGILAPTEWQFKVDLTEPYIGQSGSRNMADSTVSDGGPNCAPSEVPTYYESIGDVLTTNTAQPDGAKLASLYDGIGDVVKLIDGKQVEFQCKQITACDSETIDGVTYKYVDIADDLPSTDEIRCYYAGDLTVSTADRINRITGQLQTLPDLTRIICVNDGYDYNPQTFEGQIQVATSGTIAWAKTFSDGTTLSSSLADKLVSRTFPSGGYFYVQEPDASSGIRVCNETAAGTLQPGDVVTVSGMISTEDGERVVTGTVTTPTSREDVAPIGVINRQLGGGAFNVYTAGVSGSAFTNNVGLLVKTWGKVAEIDSTLSPQWFRIDDGSGTKPMVLCPPGDDITEDDYVAVVGVSSCELSGGDVVSVIRPGSPNDIEKLAHFAPEVDNGLPTTDLNNAAGDDRCNIRWANDAYDDDSNSYTKSYGDSFSVGTDGQWVIDRIRVWTVPEIPLAPVYFLGSHFASVTLYVGPTLTGPISLKLSGNFFTGSNQTDNPKILVRPVRYNGTTDYQTAAGDYDQIWQVEFTDLNWTVNGGDSYTFVVYGAPRVDRWWFNHATRTDMHSFLLFDVVSSALSQVPSTPWFDGHDTKINVQVFAHRI